MAVQLLPQPEKITEALAGAISFPPKIAPTVELLAEPEKFFEEQMAAMGLQVPPGPTRTLAQVLSGIEATLPAATPQIPTARTVPTVPAGRGVSLGEPEKVEVKKPTTPRTKEKIEIIEA